MAPPHRLDVVMEVIPGQQIRSAHHDQKAPAQTDIFIVNRNALFRGRHISDEVLWFGTRLENVLGLLALENRRSASQGCICDVVIRP